MWGFKVPWEAYTVHCMYTNIMAWNEIKASVTMTVYRAAVNLLPVECFNVLWPLWYWKIITEISASLASCTLSVTRSEPRCALIRTWLAELLMFLEICQHDCSDPGVHFSSEERSIIKSTKAGKKNGRRHFLWHRSPPVKWSDLK